MSTQILTKREQSKLKKRKAIIDAAEKVFFKKGLRNATMDDVTKRSKFSKATVYAYFSSKDELFFAICKRGNEILQKMLEINAAKFERGVDKVKAIGFTYFEFAEQYPDYYRFISYFIAGSDFALPEELEKEMLYLDKLLRECIEYGMQDGSIKKGVDPTIASKCLWAMASGTLQLIAHKGDLLEKYTEISRTAIVNTFFLILEESLSTESVLKDLRDKM